MKGRTLVTLAIVIILTFAADRMVGFAQEKPAVIGAAKARVRPPTSGEEAAIKVVKEWAAAHVVSFFWTQDGRIQKWLDRPLVTLSPGTPASLLQPVNPPSR